MNMFEKAKSHFSKLRTSSKYKVIKTNSITKPQKKIPANYED